MNKIQLQAAWFGSPKTARDIRRTLGKVLFPLQSHVKRFDVFLKDFDDMLNEYIFELEYDWEVTEIGGFDEHNLGGTQIDVDDFEPDIMIETPSELTLKATTSVEIRKFVMDLANLLSSDIPNKREFVSSFLNLFNNGKAANLIGKMIADRIQYYMKYEISELDEDNWGGVVHDAFADEISGASLSGSNAVSLDKGKTKSSKSRASGRGIDIAIEVAYAAEIDGSDLELDEPDYDDYDRDYDRDYADWDARFASELERTWFGGKTARRVRNPRNLFRDEPKIKQMQKIWNQMMGMVRKREFEEELYEYGIKSYLSDQISCDHLYDADDTGWSRLNPDIEMKDIMHEPRDEWFDIFRKHNRKFDHMARQILELAEEYPEDLETELSEALNAVLLDAYKRGWDGEEFEEDYDEHREGC